MADDHSTGTELHAVLEVAVVQGVRLRMAWQRPDGRWHLEALVPVGLRHRDGHECLIGRRTKGPPVEIPLERIARFDLL